MSRDAMDGFRIMGLCGEVLMCRQFLQEGREDTSLEKKNRWYYINRGLKCSKTHLGIIQGIFECIYGGGKVG